MRSALVDTVIGAALIIFAATVYLWSVPVRSEPVEVDTELVLLVDVSQSIDPLEGAMQRRGTIRALTSEATIVAIEAGALGRIAVSYVEWADQQQWQLVGWQIIDGSGAAVAFAAAIAEAPEVTGTLTGIGAALAYAGAEIDSNGIEGLRKVIDISGDGRSNIGPAPSSARRTLRSRHRHQWPADRRRAEDHFRDEVIGGGGAFVMPATDHHGFADALERKLRAEIG